MSLPVQTYHDASSERDTHVTEHYSLVAQSLCPECWLYAIACLSLQNVGRVACTCRFFRDLISDETLWRRLCARVAQAKSRQLTFSRSWRATALGSMPLQTIFSMASSTCGGATAGAQQTAVTLAKVHNRHWQELARVHAPSPEAFRIDIDLPQRPACLVGVETGLLDSDWSLAALRRTHGSTSFSVSIQEAHLHVEMTLDEYVEYSACASQSEAEPMYLFEHRTPAAMLSSFRRSSHIPALFAPDYAEALEASAHVRGTRSWLVIGGARSGSRFHVDPVGTSAWNLCLEGRKLWALYPPGPPPPGVAVLPSAEAGGSAGFVAPSAARWFEEVRPRLEEASRPRHELVQLAGEIGM